MPLDDHFSPQIRNHRPLHLLFAFFLVAWLVFSIRWLWVADRSNTELFAICMGILGLFILTGLWFRFWWAKAYTWRKWMEITVTGFIRGGISATLLGILSIFFIEMLGNIKGTLVFNVYIRLEDLAAAAAGFAYWYQNLQYGKEQTKQESDEEQSDEK